MIGLHKLVERRAGLLIFGILLVSSIGGLVQILPVLFAPPPQSSAERYPPLALAGRALYIRESCALCHSQQIRPLLAEVRRYGAASRPGEFIYDRPFLWGSKRTGPDLQRIGGKYSDAWHRLHLTRPRAVVPSSIMPAYPWLAERRVDGIALQARMRGMRRLGAEYTDQEIAEAANAVAGKSELDAMVAYLQFLGRGGAPRQ
ncbi:MAG: cytochrome-c oxidase, cbb3-type subunit II [Gammaproteobacteria bacterium]|nr:cytochrome-c oxidase, cbb3-type subunit II [Gammaproteobacteria bacterium]CAJ2377702.1 MAG: Cytochrome c oxidase subunit CcoO [Arenicellales bacterium IbO2]MDA7961123.1 cytochrome-c oxidase, cbb3-type subunit II [Gammaproteobacteria bacterium]MDA7967435.1 cytochrome-c oxidase, cbb3-type subunit II [Gammaproteobacteria bacterium]MDA7969508.1 cytochrome-c oxidase, cbb3-type subunit II [Gammaproteobacteria bacterium]